MTEGRKEESEKEESEKEESETEFCIEFEAGGRISVRKRRAADVRA